MSIEHGYDHYRLSITEVASEVIEAITLKENDEPAKVFHNHIYKMVGPTVINRKKSLDEEFFSKIFYNFIEISDSIENLHDISIYIRRFPYDKDKMSRVRYLRYNIEIFLNEMYILKERLISYAKIIERSYKGTTDEYRVKNIIQPLYKLVSEALKDIVKARGSHVHVSRYSDEDLDRLSTLELVTKSGELHKYNNLFLQEYKLQRKKWVELIEKNNRVMDILLNNYFKILYDIIFKDDDKMNYPSNLK